MAQRTDTQACMVFKTIEKNKREANRVARAWRAQEGCLGVELEPFRYSRDVVVRVYMPLPVGPLPDGCSVGMSPVRGA